MRHVNFNINKRYPEDYKVYLSKCGQYEFLKSYKLNFSMSHEMITISQKELDSIFENQADMKSIGKSYRMHTV